MAAFLESDPFGTTTCREHQEFACEVCYVYVRVSRTTQIAPQERTSLRPVRYKGHDQRRGYAMQFRELFKKGFDMMEGVMNNTIKLEDLDQQSNIAFCVFNKYLQEKEFHQNSLVSLFKNKSRLREVDLITAWSVHLLGKLCPTQSYLIDKNYKNKVSDKCSCGCWEGIQYGDTGIGHEKVWHGFVDLILSSDEGCLTGVVFGPAYVNEDVDDNDDSGDRTENTTEDSTDRKCPLFKNTRTLINQSTAQAIVLSLLQKSRHPNFDNYLIPTILISHTNFRIIMYDAENDILVRSTEMCLIREDDSLSHESVIILWMVLHYRIFCSGFPTNLQVNLMDLKSGFKDNIINHIYLYELKLFVPSFPEVEEFVDEVDDRMLFDCVLLESNN